MKKSIIIFSAIIASVTLFLSCKKESTNTEAKVKTTTAVAKAETTTFNIEGMKCAMGCAKVIETKLSSLEGVQKATVDFDKKTAIIQYDAAKQTPEKIVETVEAVADGKSYKVLNVKSTADKAMLYQVKKVANKGKKPMNKSREANQNRKNSAIVKGDKTEDTGKKVYNSAQRPDATF